MSETDDESLSDDEVNGGENADIVYALTAVPGFAGQSMVFLAGCSSGLKRSTDGGQTWEDALADLNLSEPVPVTTLAVSTGFTSDRTVIAGATGGVFRSTGGQSFQAVALPQPPPTVSALAISPNFAQDETVFAGTMQDGVFLSQNGAARWVAWNFGLLDLNVLSLAISPEYATDETIFAGTETGIFRSTNGGRAWREIELPFGFGAVISLVVSPRYRQDHTVYAGTEEHGLWASTDEGDTWARLDGEAIDEPVNAILASSIYGLLAVTGTALWHSIDEGKTWVNRMPESDEERELSAVVTPQGFGPGKQVLAGFTDGTIWAIVLK